MSHEGKIDLQYIGDIAVVRIDRQSRRNSLDDDTINEFCNVFSSIENSGERALAIVLTGMGSDSFCAGYDIHCIHPDQPSHLPLPDTRFEPVVEAVETNELPVVAALNGDAFGGGLDLALACDYRVSAKNAKLAMTPCKLGLVYSHSGISRFVQKVGPLLTRRLFLTGSTLFATEAHRLGLVDEVVDQADVFHRAMDMARIIAANAPIAVRGTRYTIGTVETSDFSRASMEQIEKFRYLAWYSMDLSEALEAFKEKRPSSFKGC